MLHVYDRSTGQSRVFRVSGDGGFHARWSPDGSRVALLGPSNGRFGLIVTNASGGDERFLGDVSGTNHPLPSAGERLSWAPDSSSVAFISSVPGPESAEANGDPVVIRRYLYKPTASEGSTRFNDNRRVHVFVADVASQSVTQLTDGDFYEHSLSFSPDGSEILFISNREADPDRFFNYDVFAVSVADKSLRRLTRTENAEYRPVFSPDGSRIAYQGTTRGPDVLRDHDGRHPRLGHERGRKRATGARRRSTTARARRAGRRMEVPSSSPCRKREACSSTGRRRTGASRRRWSISRVESRASRCRARATSPTPTTLDDLAGHRLTAAEQFLQRLDAFERE